MRTAIVNGQEAVAEIKNGDVAPAQAHGTRLA
jgi:hypothetical protein